MTPKLKNSPAEQPVRFASEPSLASRVLKHAHGRPLVWAVIVVVPLLMLGILIFRPSYDTNDDPMMSFIAAGRVVSQAPDEHLVFTHFFIGAILKRLYLWAPSVPWYAIYLFSVHAAAHVAMVYLLFKQRVRLRGCAAYLMYAAVAGLMLLSSLAFTTTAFLAVQSGLLLGMFAFLRAAEGDARLARRATVASVLFLTAAALIRWHVFMLFFSLAVPAACVLAWTHRRQRRLILKAAGLSGFVVAGLVGLALLNNAYYARDPRWGDFYSYNELRARINDLGWVYYSPETAHVFPQVGWSVNDFGMIQAWFYDDPVVYNADILHKLLDAYPWQETMPRQGRVADLLAALADDALIIGLLALYPLAAMGLGRNNSAQVTLLLSCVWVCGIIWTATVLRKPPPARIYLPILSFPLALTLFLGAMRARFGNTNSPAACDASSRSPRRYKISTVAQRAVQSACIALAAFGVVDSLGSQYERGRHKREQSAEFYRELESITGDPNKLYIVWGAGIPFELLRPTDSLQWLHDLHVLYWGWPQQCPFYGDTKRRFGIEDLPRELAERPEITLICDPACLSLMATYIREHHGREVTFEPAGKFMAAVAVRAMPATPAVIASQENAQRQ